MLRNIILLRMLQYVGSNCEPFLDLFKMLSQRASSIYSHHDAHHFTSTRHTHNLRIKTGQTGDKPNRILFVAAGNGVGAGNFPVQHLPDAYIFQVGYHQGYGLTGALPDDRNNTPQGYRRGDTQIAEFFRIIGTKLRPIFLRCKLCAKWKF